MSNSNDKTEAQIQQVKRHLLRGWHITPMKALDLYGSLRLSGIIHVLRHKHGMNIITKKVARKNGAPYAEYYLKRS